MRETDVLKIITLEVSKQGKSVLFRNNIGIARAMDDPSRIIRYGVCHPGGSDLIGFTRVTITQEMVGRTVAVFTAIEVKTPSGRIRPEQKHFIETVQGAGGIAGLARDGADATGLIDDFAKTK